MQEDEKRIVNRPGRSQSRASIIHIRPDSNVVVSVSLDFREPPPLTAQFSVQYKDPF